jgi:sugar O-acyltransferase (sialic acid O-acetyltransferase NeuD family)
MLIVGTGGHAMDTYNVVKLNGRHKEIVFYNDADPDFKFAPGYFESFRIIRDKESAKEYFKTNPEYILGIGNPLHREKLNRLMQACGGKPFTLISDKALIGEVNNVIESGACIMHHVVVTINTVIGEGTLVNTGTVVTHDCRIGKYAEIGPGVKIAGACTVKDHAFIGTGAVLLPKVTVGEHAVVAAGAVVIKDVAPYTMVAGNPAVVKKVLK